ncbi:hypothetical protein BDW74DRAFT_15372 [Aspergillus multicolor]|uniref:cytochrome P450 n=1 Tax=Aspergillus multicolor TaxID=41759 RepID=UPI003CCE33CC
MADPAVASIIAAAAAVSIYLVIALRNVGRRPADYPPGPPTLPIIGNLHLMPSKYPHQQFKKWAEEYGPIYSLVLGTKTYIVLSSDVAVKDLLDKRGANYSSRPEIFIGHEIASGGLRLVTMPYGPLWRMMHKIIHGILNIRAAKAYLPYQMLERQQMLLGFLEQPNEFVKHLRRYSFSLTTQIIYGFRAQSIHHPKLQQLITCFESWGEVVGNASAQILDLFPVLRKLPKFLLPSYRYAQELHRVERKLYTDLWMDAKQEILAGTAKPNFCVDLLKAQEVEKFSDAQAGYISGSLLEAGSDTTASMLSAFVLAMVVFPDVQAKSQEEIDRVVGPDRLPTMDDAPNMPYIRACVKETLRWMPTVILGTPHCAINEDSYMGYRISAGSTIITNVWALQMDPKRHPNPRAFEPSRFIDHNLSEFEAAMDPDPSKRGNFVFGTGRRLCQGMHIAERSMFLAISGLLWAFTFDKPLDAQGKPVTPDIDDLVGGIAVQPAPFEAVIEPRSAAKAEILRREWKECEEMLLDKETHQWKEVPEDMAFGKNKIGSGLKVGGK